MPAFWTSRACAPWRRCILENRAGKTTTGRPSFGGPAPDQPGPRGLVARAYRGSKSRVPAAAGGAKGVVSGNLSTIAEARTVADQVNKLGRLDAVFHNAGVGHREERGEREPGVPSVFAVNALAPYILTAMIEKPKRLVFVSSGMHRGVRPRMDDLPLDQAIVEWRIGLRGKQAMRCFAGVCRRPMVEGGQVQRAGAWVSSDKDKRPFRPGRPPPGVRNPGMACHERGRWRGRPAGISIINALVPGSLVIELDLASYIRRASNQALPSTPI